MLLVSGNTAAGDVYPQALEPRAKWTSSIPLPFLPADENTSGFFNTTLRSFGSSNAVPFLMLALNPLNTNQTTITITGVSDNAYFNLTSIAFLTVKKYVSTRTLG